MRHLRAYQNLSCRTDSCQPKKTKNAPRPLALATAAAPRPPPGAAPATAVFPASSTLKTRNPHSSPAPPSSPTVSSSSSHSHGQIGLSLPQLPHPLPQSVAAAAPLSCSAPWGRAPSARRRAPPQLRSAPPRGRDPPSALPARPPAPRLAAAVGLVASSSAGAGAGADPQPRLCGEDEGLPTGGEPDARRGLIRRPGHGEAAQARDVELPATLLKPAPANCKGTLPQSISPLAGTQSAGAIQGRQSYKEALLSKNCCCCREEGGRLVASCAGEDGSVAIGPWLVSATAERPGKAEEKWQIAQRRCNQPKSKESRSSRVPSLRGTCRARLLSKLKGRCFRCLARDHQVADCRDPVRCWVCCRSGHTSTVCPSRSSRASASALPIKSDRWHCPSSPPTSCQHNAPQQQIQLRRQASFLSKMQGLCFNCLAQDHRVAQCSNPIRCWWCYKPGHIFARCPNRHRRQRSHGETVRAQPPGRRGRLAATMWRPASKAIGGAQGSDKVLAKDPMVLEAGLGTPERPRMDLPSLQAQRPKSEEDQEALDSNLEGIHMDGLQSPSMPRSEEEQFVGQQLIKALSSFKQIVVPPQPPFMEQNEPSVQESTDRGKEGYQQHSRKLKLKTKSHRPAIKVVRDMLTRKWIFVKEDKQLGDWTLRRFLDTYEKLSSANNVAAVRNLMQRVRKLSQASENLKKKKKKKKVFVD